MSKIKLHLSIGEYEFVEVEAEGELEKDEAHMAAAAKETYDTIKAAFKPRPINELEPKAFNAFIDAQLLGEPNHLDQWEKMSPKQVDIAQTIKRALARLEARDKRKD